MTNKAKQKGSFAEKCVRDYLRSWYPDREAHGAGHLWAREPSQGAKDEGDVKGPHTTIEVKNYSNPPESGLLSNAQRKGEMSGLRYWFLVYKAKGCGLSKIGQWHAMTTIGHLTSATGWSVTPVDEGIPDTESLLLQLPALCKAKSEVVARFAAPAYGESFPDEPWSVRLLCDDFMAKREIKRKEILDTHRESSGLLGLREVPFVVSPRYEPAPNGGVVLRPVEEWYAYAKFEDFAHALEGVGVLPVRLDSQETSLLIRA